MNRSAPQPDPQPAPGDAATSGATTSGAPDTRTAARSASPLFVFEDEHVLVVNKPPGWNTHAPSPYAGEGIYDWLRHRELRWSSLAIVHRLDKETSGLLVFTKTRTANQSLTRQFTERGVQKTYVFLTHREPRREKWTVRSRLIRRGDQYVVSEREGELAETHFKVREHKAGSWWVEAEPYTGRTHQIRVHAAHSGVPVLGDRLYGGAPASRLCLHATRLVFDSPSTGEPMRFEAPADFGNLDPADTPPATTGSAAVLPGLSLRRAIIDPALTSAYRLLHGASDGWPGWYLDRLGPYLLSQAEGPLREHQATYLAGLAQALDNDANAPNRIHAVYHKRLRRHLRGSTPQSTSPELVSGTAAADQFEVLESGVRFQLRFGEGYSVGLFLDQRENRRRFLVNHVAAGFPLVAEGLSGRTLLNTFAYTCGFSVCAARSGMRTTNIDLSKKYLAWGRSNFAANALDPGTHEFLAGDVFDWLRRLRKKQRLFDVIVLDPPTFSQSDAGIFRAEKDFGQLVTEAMPLLNRGGVLLASSNAARLSPAAFVAAIIQSIEGAGRRVVQQHYVPQPPDFPITREEPGYLKTFWVRTCPS